MNLKQTVFFCVFVLSLPSIALGGYSSKTKITSIQTQHNRTYISFEPDISQTACSDKNTVEIANKESSSANPNRDWIMSIALTAFASDKYVQWITSDQCSNVGHDMVNGIKVYVD